jgi:hypothetical protein
MWRKSTRSNGTANCVEFCELQDRWAVRDSKAGENSPVLLFSTSEWATFIQGVKDGEFNI